MAANGSGAHQLAGQAPPAEFAGAKFVVPKKVTWTAPDGLTIEGQLFQAPDAKTGSAKNQPAVIFVHGGSFRQMILGWSYMDYYSNAYAMNQYMAACWPAAVLSVNYRLGIAYGWDFQHWPKGGALGSSEYQDVAAAGRFLQATPGVDGQRIGIWGGSYGGLLTALALARNSSTSSRPVSISTGCMTGRGASPVRPGRGPTAMRRATWKRRWRWPSRPRRTPTSGPGPRRFC